MSVQPLTEAEVKKFMAIRPSSSILDAISRIQVKQLDGTQRRTPPRGPEEQKRAEKSTPETRTTIRRGTEPHPPKPNQQDGTKRRTPPRGPEEQKRGEKSAPETRTTIRKGTEPHPPGPNHQGLARKTSKNLWIDIFNEIQEEELEEGYGDSWTLQFNYDLTNKLSPEKRLQGWKVSERPSFGSFTCSHCSHSWTSARIYIVFHYRLQKRAERGQVRMRPFRQQCRECHHKDYMTPKFDENTIEEILMVLIGKIKKNCYHDVDPDELVALGPSQTFLIKPHHEKLCEACQLDICTKAEPSAFGISRGTRTQPRINAPTRLMLPASNMVSNR